MAEPTWGMLAKSQVDPETIEQAIERIVDAHNEDETAHIGEGRSLENHKANEVIDHPADSVVQDKIAANSISADKLQANSVIAEKINVDNLSAISADLGTINAGKIEVIAGANTVGLTPAEAVVIKAGPTGSPRFTVSETGDTVAKDIRIASLSWQRLTLMSSFESFDGWKTTGVGTSVYTPKFGGSTIKTAFGSSNNFALLYSDADFAGNIIFNADTKSPLLQFTYYYSSEDNGNAFVGLSIDNTWPLANLSTDEYIGFRISGSAGGWAYAVHKKAGQAAVETQIDFFPGEIRTYRFVVTNAGGAVTKIQYYKADVLVATHTTNLPNQLENAYLCAGLKNSNTSDETLTLLNLLYSQNF